MKARTDHRKVLRGYTGFCFDCGTQIKSLVSDGRTKHINHYCSCGATVRLDRNKRIDRLLANTTRELRG